MSSMKNIAFLIPTMLAIFLFISSEVAARELKEVSSRDRGVFSGTAGFYYDRNGFRNPFTDYYGFGSGGFNGGIGGVSPFDRLNPYFPYFPFGGGPDHGVYRRPLGPNFGGIGGIRPGLPVVGGGIGFPGGGIGGLP